MALSATIDKLLVTELIGKDLTVQPRQYQIIIPNFPPLMTINFTVEPLISYAHMLYQFSWGSAMVPRSFDIKMYVAGTKLIDTTSTSRISDEPIDTLALITRGNPASINITNVTLLVQYYEWTTFYLDVQDASAYGRVEKALEGTKLVVGAC